MVATYVIYGRAGAQSTLIKVLDRLQWLEFKATEGCYPKIAAFLSTLEPISEKHSNTLENFNFCYRMDRHPEGHPAWLEMMNPNRVVALVAPLAGDPYHPEVPPIVPDDSSDEEDPEEDPEGYHTGDDYVPADVPDLGPVEAEESEPEECLTEEEEEIIAPISPPRLLPQHVAPITSPRPHVQPRPSGGKGPMIGMTSSTRDYMARRPDLYSFVDRVMSDIPRTSTGPSVPAVPAPCTLLDRPICGGKRKATDGPSLFETGESSQAPLPVIPDTQAQITVLTERIRVLENQVRSSRASALTTDRRVLRIEEEEKGDATAIQVLFHRVNAGRAETRNQHTLIGNLQHNGHMVDHQVDAAERRIVILQEEYLQLQVKFEELTRYLAARFGH